MRSNQIRLAFFLLAFTAFLIAQAEPPSSFPKVGQESGQLLLVVATLSLGGELPQFEECGKPNVACMDPPPFWLDVNVLSTIYGPTAPAKLYAATTSHYGMMEYGDDPYLVTLITNGKDFIMRRYGNKILRRKKNGELHLVVVSPSSISWLPCSVSSLEEEISAEDFENNLEIPNAFFDQYQVIKNISLYRKTASGAVPRYSISVERLQEHLAELDLKADHMSCGT